MSGTAELRIELWTKTWQRAGWVSTFDNFACTVPAVGAATASFTTDADSEGAAELLTPGTRVTIDYRPPRSSNPADPAPAWRQLAAGRVQVSPAGPTKGASLSVSLIDHWSALNVLALPVPGAALNAQTIDQYTATGPAEDVITGMVTPARTRLSLPLTVPTSSHRGSSVSVTARMARLADHVSEAATRGGLSARVRQVAGGLSLALGVGIDRTGLVLAERSANVASWAWTITPPTATRVIVGGQGEGAARTFVAVADTTAESTWGAKLEAFVDARDVDSASPTYLAQLSARGTAALADASARVEGLKVTLEESDSLAYGVNLSEHDLVAVELVPGFVRTARVAEVQIAASSTDGLSVTPVIGDPTVNLPERVQAQIIGDLARAVAKLRAR